MDAKVALILGIKLNSNTQEAVLNILAKRLKNRQKTTVVTPNPEFVVYAQNQPWFKELLRSADLTIPDGIGIIYAAKILGQPKLNRVAGADLTQKLLEISCQKNWRIGIVGARRNNLTERQSLLSKLQQKYPGVEIKSIEETPNWRLISFDIIFACQGMGKQEQWMADNRPKSKGIIFIGVGGALDYLAGLVPRAPVLMRRVGLEWFYRLIRQPWRIRRQLNLVKFGWLLVVEIMNNNGH